jgi:hypothetical protein
MPNTGIYRFTFTGDQNSDITIDFSTDGQTFTRYRGNQKLALNCGDSFQIALRGPTGWSMNGGVQVLISRANNARSGQNYSPFANGVYFAFGPSDGILSADPTTGTSTFLIHPFPGGITGNGRGNNYEVTIAFPMTFNGVTQFFSVDPEMDISTT